MAAAGQQTAPGSAIHSAANPETTQETVAEGSEAEVWDEARLEQSMRRLKEMHIQLRNLRTTIPRLIAPLTVQQPSPESLFSSFSESARTANKEVQDFKRLIKDEESVKVFEQAKKSREEHPDGIKPWRVTEHPDWLDRNT